MANCKRCFLGGNDDCYPHVAEDKECDIFRSMTNADRIRSMSDEKLADWLTGIHLLTKEVGVFGEVSDKWLKWLQQEYE